MYSFAVLKIAAKKSFMHVSWLIVLICTPILLFNAGLSFNEKVILFMAFLVGFWGLYFMFCVLFHRISLKNEMTKNNYLAMSDIDKGNDVGSKLDGW